ncbi:MAG TPA: AlkA N-terminal domain-containing protein [Nevskiaceae bacterium]|nr:AlkA N-terminal domain-containing protein [Nevskiaceae bacterium]
MNDIVRSTLRYTPPLAWRAFSQFLAGRSAASVESIHDGRYWRTVRLNGVKGWISVGPSKDPKTLSLRFPAALAPHAKELRTRLQNSFDLAADPIAIDRDLSRDKLLRPLIARTPGLRVPGAFDGLELAVRAVLGQRISVKVATILAGKIAAYFGETVETPNPELRFVFPSADRLADASSAQLRGIGLGGPPVEAIRSLAIAVAENRLTLQPGPRAEHELEMLPELPGIGPWTAQYIGMRALRMPDAFPHSDLGLVKALGLTPAKVLSRAEAWRPWRAYAAVHLWSTLS